VLQEQEFERVGGTSSIKVDVRIVATTNRDLAAEADQGTFRQDLYYRLSTIPVLIPPLRDRPEDIAVLALRFAMRTAAELGKKIDGLSPDALESMQHYPWPGNIRELQHVIERAVILTPDPMIHAHCLEGTRFGLAHSLGAPSIRPRAIPTPGSGRAVATSTPPVAGMAIGGATNGNIALASLNVADAERVLIQHALAAADNNRTKAAELLGISVRTLRNKLNGPGKDADGDDE
jgi:DNA-binding NtrC family response regulator